MVFSLEVKRRLILSITVAILVLSYLFHNSSFLTRTLSTIAFLVVFYVIDYYFDVKFNIVHYVCAFAITILGILLSPLYFISTSYDKLLHLTMPVLYCVIVLHMVSKLQLKIKWELVFTLFVVLGSLTLFEIGEYTLDQFFDFKLQGVYARDTSGLEKYTLIQDKLNDTMIDLILGVIGTLTFVSIRAALVISKNGYAYLHKVRYRVPPHRKRSM